jgi:DNA-binding IclR family transcriptional regulator
MDTTLQNGLMVLEALARSARPRSVEDLAMQTELNESNVQSALEAFEFAGYLAREPATGRYGLSLKLWGLGVGLLSRLDLKREAQRHLSELALRTRETVHLSVLTGSDVIYIDKIDSPELLHASSEIGGKAPAHAVAIGKAILAFQPAHIIEAIGRNLAVFTPKTVNSLEALQHELSTIRSQGYAVNLGEWRGAVYGLAAPIRRADGVVEAAVGISGPSTRLTSEMSALVAEQVVEAADDISRGLGYRGGRG